MLTGVDRRTRGEMCPKANCSTTDPVHTKPRSKLVPTESSANNCLNRSMNNDAAKHSNVGGLSGDGEQKEKLIKQENKTT